MIQSYKGGVKIIILLIAIIIILIISAISFGYGGDSVQDAKEIVKDKTQGVIEEKSAEVVAGAIDGGREVIGKTLKETGEKMLLDSENPGFYGSYSDDDVKNYEKTILFFTADWCPSCTKVEATIKENKKKIPADVAIVKIDFDNSGGLRDEYGVNKQHTFILIDKNNEEVKRWQNSKTLNEIIDNIN